MPRLLDPGLFSIVDTDSSIGVGWKLNFYTTGSSTRKDTYPTLADAGALTNPNANPIVVGADGRLPPIWMLDDEDYKGVLTDENDVVKETTDPLTGTVVGEDDDTPTYPLADGEIGAFNLEYPVGWAPRYGVFPDGATNWENDTAYLNNMLRTGLAGHKLYFPKVGQDYLYATGWNWTNRYGYSGINIEIEEGVEWGGIWHLISSGSPVFRKAPTAITAGATTVVTVSGGHGMSLTHPRYVTFTGTDMAALDDQNVFCTPTSATQCTIDADTTGQVWGSAGEFHDTPISNIRVTGTFVTYDRFGAIWAQGVSIDRIWCKSDSSVSIYGEEGRGVHVYGGCYDWDIGEIVADDLGPQSENPTNHAAVAFDGDTVEPRNIRIGRIWVKDSQASGVVLKGSGYSVGQIVVDAFGRGGITTAPESVSGTDLIGDDASDVAAAVWLVRGCGHIGSIHIGQKLGYASGRAFAVYGVVVEGGQIDWASAVSFAQTRQGWHIGLVQVRDVNNVAVALGPFGQFGYARIDKIDIGKVQATNNMVTDSSRQIAQGHVWVSNGSLSFGQITSSALNASCALKVDPDADAFVQGGSILIHTHIWRAVWHRGNGPIESINILDRTGTETVPSVAVDGSSAGIVNIGMIRARNVSASTGPFLIFSPQRGTITTLDIQDYAPTTAGVAAVRFGSAGSERIYAVAGYIFKAGTNAGTGLIIDGTSDSRVDNFRVEGFALGVDDGVANTRLTCIGCVAVSNDTNTGLDSATLTAASAANVTWATP